jgi:hypothetical protein
MLPSIRVMTRWHIWLTIVLVASPMLPCAGGELIRDFGSYSFKDEDREVVVSLQPKGDSGLAVKVTAPTKWGSGSIGTGKDSPIAIAAQRWAAEFRPPHELWIYDGQSELHLYERTAKGFKASSSGVVPSLWQRAPDALRQFMDRSRREPPRL